MCLASPFQGCQKVVHKYIIVMQVFCEREKHHIPILQISKKKHIKTDSPLRGDEGGSQEPGLQASCSGQEAQRVIPFVIN